METTQTIKTKTKILRAVGYCRTSGEGQRDNTSIGRQKEAIESFVKHKNWQFKHHYVDECKSGSHIKGRDSFQQMMKDAEQNEFDVIVPYDVTRFARDGCDIISNATFLKKTYGVDVVDTKSFDTRDRHRIITNYVQAGVAEDERLRIMERTIHGRIRRAKDGLPWSANPPAGRTYDKDKGKWNCNDEGKKLCELLPRYVNGESLDHLAKEYCFASANSITRKVRECQLSGTYHVKFNSPEIGIENLEIPVPAIPEIITPELEKRVRDRLAHNRTCNKQNKRKYLLTGFVRCAYCKRSLTGQTPKHSVRYKHKKVGCNFGSIQGSILENHALDYLYGLFLDEPAYNKAVRNALPDDDDRKALEKDIKYAKRQLAETNKELRNIVDAVAEGRLDTDISTDKQNELKAEKRIKEMRVNGLEQTLANMPDCKQTVRDAKLLRLKLMSNYWGQDWHQLNYEDIRQFLHFLFGVNPKKSGYGIFVDKINGEWKITFEGCIESINVDELAKTVDEIVPAVDELKGEVKQAKQIYNELQAYSKPKVDYL